MKFLSLPNEKNRDAFHTSPATLDFLCESVTNGCFEVLPALSDNGDQGFNVVFDPEGGYPALLRKNLLTLYPRAQLNIINAGISGNSAPGGLARMECDLLPYHPDLTVVCYGLNDCGAGDAHGGGGRGGSRMRRLRKMDADVQKQGRHHGSLVKLPQSPDKRDAPAVCGQSYRNTV